MQNICILLGNLLIIIALLIAVNIYFNLIKHHGNEKHLLQFYFTYSKLKEVIY